MSGRPRNGPLADVAPLGFNAAKWAEKPDKGNSLMEFVQPPRPETGDQSDQVKRWHVVRPSTSPSALPSWRTRTDGMGRRSLEAVTETYYTTNVKPIIDRLLQSIFLKKPVHVVDFASSYFTGSSNSRSDVSVAQGVTWQEYDAQYLRPAKLFLIQPLIHLLMSQRPATVREHLHKLFRVYLVLADRLTSSREDGGVTLEAVSGTLTDVLWCITDEQLQTLNAALGAVTSSKTSTLQIIELVLRVPLEISERICVALVDGADGIDTLDRQEEENRRAQAEAEAEAAAAEERRKAAAAAEAQARIEAEEKAKADAEARAKAEAEAQAEAEAKAKAEAQAKADAVAEAARKAEAQLASDNVGEEASFVLDALPVGLHVSRDDAGTRVFLLVQPDGTFAFDRTSAREDGTSSSEVKGRGAVCNVVERVDKSTGQLLWTIGLHGNFRVASAAGAGDQKADEAAELPQVSDAAAASAIATDDAEESTAQAEEEESNAHAKSEQPRDVHAAATTVDVQDGAIRDADLQVLSAASFAVGAAEVTGATCVHSLVRSFVTAGMSRAEMRRVVLVECRSAAQEQADRVAAMLDEAFLAL